MFERLATVATQGSSLLYGAAWTGLLLCAAFAAHAQTTSTQSPFFSPSPRKPAPPPSSPPIARIDDRVITQQDFDRIAQPYFERLKEQLKQGFTPELQQTAARNVMNELIRRELLVIEAKRRAIPVNEAQTDRLLAEDPFFKTNGAFDPQKLIQFKISPGSNYALVLPKVRELVAAGTLDSMLRARFTPSPAALRTEWARRNEQVRFRCLALSPRDVSLDAEATDAERAAYYAAHPDRFTGRGRIALRARRLPLPASSEARRKASVDSTMRRARAWADSLRAGASIDSLGGGPGVYETGQFELPATVIPGFGQAPTLAAAVAGADSDTTIRVVGPVTTEDEIVVATVSERHRHGLQPFAEVLPEVRQLADAEKRASAIEARRRAYYEAHRAEYVTPQVQVKRVLLPESALPTASPSPREIASWYAAHGRTLFALPDTSGAWMPALSDSLRARVRTRLQSEDRLAKAGSAMRRLAELWSAGRDLDRPARAAGATVETRSLIRGAGDHVFPTALVDSLLNTRFDRLPTPIEGPHLLAGRYVLWRVEARDSAFAPPYDMVRARVETAVAEEQRNEDEREARAFFEAHRARYTTPRRYVIETIVSRTASPESVAVSEGAVRAHYEAHLAEYREDEQVHARHILVTLDPAQGDKADARARVRADSLARAIAGGADFGELAKRFSQDPGSASQGGDLGFFARGRMVKEFQDSAFALAPGRVSQPVRTRFGYHLIRVDEHRPAGVRPLAAVHDEIRRMLGLALADSIAQRRARTWRRAIARGADPRILAGASGGVVRSEPFSLDQPVPGLGSAPELERALDRLPMGRWAPTPYRVGPSYALVRPVERQQPRPAEFDEVRGEAIRDVKNAKREELLAHKVAAIRAALAAGTSLDSVAAPFGGLKDSGFLGTSPGFVPFLGLEPRVIGRALTLAPGTASDTIRTAQGVAWVQTEEKRRLPGGSFEKDRIALTQELITRNYAEWVETKKRSAKIEILRPDLRAALAPAPQPFSAGR